MPTSPCSALKRITPGHAALFSAMFAVGTLDACNSDAAGPAPSVRYVLDAPFCGGSFPVIFYIDNAQIGTDTLKVNVPTPRLTSNDFTTTTGPHTIGARLVGGYVWANKTVNLAPGQVYTDSLPFYCS